MEPSKIQKRKFIIATMALVLVACFILAEAGIRVYHMTCDRQRFVWLPDDFLAYIHSAGNQFKHHFSEEERITVSHQTNAFGFLNGPVTVQKGADTLRVLVLGDSFTEALQVPREKNYSGLLEQRLQEHAGREFRKVEVLNAGVSGYSPLNYYLSFKRELGRFKPDLVLVQIFANDVFEDNTARAKSLSDQEGLPLKTHRYFVPEHFDHPPIRREEFDNNPIGYRTKRFLIEHSRAFEYFYVKFYNMRKASAFHQKMIREPQYGTGFQFFILDPNHVLSRDVDFRNQAWAYTQKLLLALKNEVEKQGSQFALFYMPMEVQLDLDQYGTHVSLYMREHMGRYFNEMLAQFSRENNVRFLDLLDDFERNKGQGLFLDRDGHLTESGHLVAADSLFHYIKENNLIAPER